jgi:hypothetical protein
MDALSVRALSKSLGLSSPRPTTRIRRSLIVEGPLTPLNHVARDLDDDR